MSGAKLTLGAAALVPLEWPVGSKEYLVGYVDAVSSWHIKIILHTLKICLKFIAAFPSTACGLALAARVQLVLNSDGTICHFIPSAYIESGEQE